MSAFTEAEEAIGRNWRLVVAYVISSMALLAAYVFALNQLKALVPEGGDDPVWFTGATLGLEIVLQAGAAAVQAIVFAAIGAEIDRPLWKHKGALDALSRFFLLWFLVALVHVLISQAQSSLLQRNLESAAWALVAPQILWYVAYMPIGTAIMYGGQLKWSEVPDRLMPIAHVVHRSLLAFGLGFFQFTVWLVILFNFPKSQGESPLFQAVHIVPLLLIECLTFAVMWHACMEYRDTAADRDDDFDF